MTQLEAHVVENSRMQFLLNFGPPGVLHGTVRPESISNAHLPRTTRHEGRRLDERARCSSAFVLPSVLF